MDGRLSEVGIDIPEFSPIGNFEGLMANDIDISRYPAGMFVNSADSFGIEPYRRPLGCNGETMMYVTNGFIIGERTNTVTN